MNKLYLLTLLTFQSLSGEKMSCDQVDYKCANAALQDVREKYASIDKNEKQTMVAIVEEVCKSL